LLSQPQADKTLPSSLGLVSNYFVLSRYLVNATLRKDISSCLPGVVETLYFTGLRMQFS